MRSIIGCQEKRTVIACNNTRLSKGICHPDRRMVDTHDLLYLLDGSWEICLEGTPYLMKPDDVLLLHAGLRHCGRIECAPNTQVMFIHFARTETDATTEGTCLPCWEDALLIDTLTHCGKSPNVKRLFREIIGAYYSDKPCKGIYLSGLLSELLYAVFLTAYSERAWQTDDPIVNEAIFLMRTMPQQNLTAAEMAQRLYVSERTFTSRLKKTTGLSYLQYQNQVRMELSRRLLLAERDLPLCVIAQTFGYYDEAHFSKVFKKAYGLSPSAYRRESPVLISDQAGPSARLCGC